MDWISRRDRTYTERKILGKAAPQLILDPYFIDVDAASFDTLPCCGIKGPTHPGPCLFLANGFGLVDTAPPDYQFLALKFDRSAGCRSRLRNIIDKCVSSGVIDVGDHAS